MFSKKSKGYLAKEVAYLIREWHNFTRESCLWKQYRNLYWCRKVL